MRERDGIHSCFNKKDKEVMKNINTIVNKMKSEQNDETYFLTGFTELDNCLQVNSDAGSLVVVGARPLMGKTSFALNIVSSFAEETSRPVAIFSLEMPAKELVRRMLSQKSNVPTDTLRNKSYSESDHQRITKSRTRMSSFKIFIDSSGAIDVKNIQNISIDFKKENGLGLIVIDYLQLITPLDQSKPTEQQIADKVRELKLLSRKLECPILLLSQLNRDVEYRPNKRPELYDLRGSGAIEQDADVVMFIYRDDYYYPDSTEPGTSEIIIAKNRFAPPATVKLAWEADCTNFHSLSK